MFGFVVNYDGIYSTIRKVEIDEAEEFDGNFLHTSFAAAKNELVNHLTTRRDDYRWAIKELRTFTVKDIQVSSDLCGGDE